MILVSSPSFIMSSHTPANNSLQFSKRIYIIIKEINIIGNEKDDSTNYPLIFRELVSGENKHQGELELGFGAKSFMK